MVDDSSPYRIGLWLSCSAHVVILAALLAGIGLGGDPLEDPKIYSVTVEGGKQLGGIQQVPKDDKKEPVAPAKNVSASKPQKNTEEETVPDKVTQPEKPVEDAEVSLAEQEKIKEEERKKKEEEDKQRKEDERKKLEKQKEDKKKAEEEKAAKEKAEKEKRQKAEAEEVNKRLEAALQRYKGESANAGGQNTFGAAARGGNGMGGGVVLPLEVLAYVERVKAAVKNKWLWTDTQTPLRAAVVFKLDIDGRVSDLSISSSSGNSQYDESLRIAIKNANPLPPPPAAFYEQYLKNPRMFFDSSESQ